MLHAVSSLKQSIQCTQVSAGGDIPNPFPEEKSHERVRHEAAAPRGPLRSPPPPRERQKAAPARCASYDTPKCMTCETGHEGVQLRFAASNKQRRKHWTRNQDQAFLSAPLPPGKRGLKCYSKVIVSCKSIFPLVFSSW